MAQARPSPTSCSCRRPSSATPTRRSWPSRWPATSWSTTARAAGTAWPSRPATVWPSATSSRTSATGRYAIPGLAGRPAREDDFDPFDEARMLAATVDGLRIVSRLRAQWPGRRLAVLPGQARLVRARSGGGSTTSVAAGRGDQLLRRRRLQRRPDRSRRLGRGGRPRRHPCQRTRASGVPGTTASATSSTPTARARRAGSLHVVGLPGRHVPQELRDAHRPLLLAGPAIASRIVDAEIDRDARKGPPIPSDHAPMTIDLDEPGKPYDPDWAGALARIAKRTR